MKNSKFVFLSVILFFVSHSELFSKPKPKFKKTIRAEGGLPHEFFSNKAFRQTFSGLVTTGVSYNMGYHNFNIGVFGSLTEFQILYQYVNDPNSIQNNYTGGFRFSYDLLTSSGKGMFSPFVAPGYSFLKYTKLQYKTSPPTQRDFNALSCTVGITYNMLLIDDWTGVGFVAGYTFLNTGYDPHALAQDQIYPNYTDNRGNLQNFYFGFCVYFDFARPRDTDSD